MSTAHVAERSHVIRAKGVTTIEWPLTFVHLQEESDDLCSQSSCSSRRAPTVIPAHSPFTELSPHRETPPPPVPSVDTQPVPFDQLAHTLRSIDSDTDSSLESTDKCCCKTDNAHHLPFIKPSSVGSSNGSLAYISFKFCKERASERWLRVRNIRRWLRAKYERKKKVFRRRFYFYTQSIKDIIYQLYDYLSCESLQGCLQEGV